ncbi:MAG: HEPN domain-containing protein, partial [Nitrososphaera sp.]|nr:HEPN domain-containing protein [Nitrososphaera sp.]
MDDRLKQAFGAFVALAKSRLTCKTSPAPKQGVKEIEVLRDGVRELESTREFGELVAATRLTFFETDKEFESFVSGVASHAVGHFFRRSKYYFDVFDEKPVNEEEIFAKYCDAFLRKKVRTTYLAPMDSVRFSEDSMDFGSFQIMRFKAGELREVLQGRINETFYPMAVVDTGLLEDYWFICATDESPAPPINPLQMVFPIDFITGRIKLEYSSYPTLLESVLQQLSLFDWQAEYWKEESQNETGKTKEEDLARGWHGFHVPFLLSVDDNLLEHPRRAPDVVGLETTPILNPETGEEEGEIPVYDVSLDTVETATFKDFVQRTSTVLTALRQKPGHWHFIEVALGNFVRAFFTRHRRDQLLWHIVTLESLLGEKGEGVTKRLARRCSSILGSTKEEKREIERQLEELYDFRSDLIHGSEPEKDLYEGHLRRARNL